jgi:hypothetical protein
MASKDLIVVLNATSERGTMTQYLRQLYSAGIEYYIKWMDGYPAGGGDMQHKVNLFREMTDKFRDYDKIVFSDAFDVTFYGEKLTMLAKIPDGVMFAGEKNCYPDPTVADRIKGVSPWKFVNGGLTCGSVDGVRRWTEEIVKHPSYIPNALDQFVLNNLRVEESPLAVVDERTELFLCLFCGYPELEFEKGIPLNTLCGTHPQFLHGNGSWQREEMFAKYERSML